MTGAARAIGDDENMRVRGLMHRQAIIIIAKAADMGMRTATHARGEQHAVCAGARLLRVIGFPEGIMGIGRQIFPQAFRIGIDVEHMAGAERATLRMAQGEA